MHTSAVLRQTFHASLSAHMSSMPRSPSLGRPSISGSGPQASSSEESLRKSGSKGLMLLVLVVKLSNACASPEKSSVGRRNLGGGKGGVCGGTPTGSGMARRRISVPLSCGCTGRRATSPAEILTSRRTMKEKTRPFASPSHEMPG